MRDFNIVTIFSFGIVMWELVTRRMPYDDHPKFQWIREVEEVVCSGKRPTVPRGVSDEYESVMKDCWRDDADRRPTFTEIVRCLDTMENVVLFQETASSV